LQDIEGFLQLHFYKVISITSLKAKSGTKHMVSALFFPNEDFRLRSERIYYIVLIEKCHQYC